jgi:hypothetical protein
MRTKRNLLKVVLAPTLLASFCVSASAAVYVFDANLSGPNEFPANASPGTGFAQVTYDNLAHTLNVNFTFSGLVGTTTASHIHAATLLPGSGTAGVATQTPYFTGFPIGVTSGSYNNTFDLTQSSSWNSAFITANGGTTASAESALSVALFGNMAYLNIHSTVYGGGEIRGFLTLVPEPSSAALIGLGSAVVWAMRRRKTAC